MKALAIIIAILSLTHPTPKTEPTCYSAYTETGIHLIMSDNGTETPEDDFVVDWESNREFTITIQD